MIIKRQRAFTLIELLIVIAILAIVAASSMAVISGPMYERVRAEEEEAFEAGAGIFFATLVRDFHGADSVNVKSGGEEIDRIILTDDNAGTSRTIAYAVNKNGSLERRIGASRPATLIDSVIDFRADKSSTGSLWTVSISARLHGYGAGEFTTVTRRMDVLAANATTGGGR